MANTEPGTFDATGYRQRVLSVLRNAAMLDVTDDPFFIVDLPVDVDDPALIQARIKALVAFWNKEKSPNYKRIAAELAKRRGELEAVLLDPATRGVAAARVRTVRAAANANRYGDLDALADKLVARYQGVPRSRVPQLTALANGKGLDNAAFAEWLTRHHIIEDSDAVAEPLPPAVRSVIRGCLDELGRLTGDPVRSATLWTLLDLPPTAMAEEVSGRYAELYAENQRRPHDRQQTVVADLLACVKQHLMAGDRARYAASLVEDAKDRLSATVAEAVIVDGALSAADFDACVRKALAFGFGLSPEEARAAVRRLATSLGASVETAPPIDYVLCASCREPQPADGRGACRYCGAALYTACPSCAQRVEAAAVACPHCGANFRLIRAAAERLASASAAIAEGHPASAKAMLAGIRGTAVPSLAHDLDALSSNLDRILAAAAADWRNAERDIADRRLYSAVDKLNRIARTAADVPGPNNAAASERLADLAARKAAVQAEVAAARQLEPAEQEVALARILTAAADCVEALDLVAKLPLAPPSAVRAEVAGEAVALRWQPSSAPGAVSYKVSRLVAGPEGRVEARTLGTTGACHFEDAGVPGGCSVAHQVAAVSGRRTSAVVATKPVLLLRDLTGLAARTGPEGITLTWSLPPGAGTLIVERTAEDAVGISLPMRRARAEGQSWTDRDATPGVTFSYRVYVEYRLADGSVLRTPGATTRARMVPRPRPVTELGAATNAGGETTISWRVPPAGEVRVYAGSAPLAEPDTDVDLVALARAGRFVGSGRRRVVDPKARGAIMYTTVTVDGDRAVAGPSLAHLAVPVVGNATVTDTGSELVVTFAMPPGVTEAMVAARRDQFPIGPEDPNAQTWKVTNTKLEIAGGLRIAAPADGGAWYVCVYSAVRNGPRLLVAPAGMQLEARPGTPITASYTVRRTGLRKKAVVVDVTSDGPLPPLVVYAKADAVPRGTRDGVEIGRLEGGTSRVRHEFTVDNLPSLPAGVRLFAAAVVPGRPFTLTDPPETGLILY